jgi:transposase
MKPPDEIINFFPDYCACGHQLEIGQAFSVEQKIEIPPIKPYITEYHLYQGVCRACGKKKTASLPTDIQPDLLGNHAKAIISTLSGFFHNSKRDVQQILQNVFNLPISLGLVSMSEKRVSQKLETSYENLVDQVEDSSYLHIDETGHKCRGKRGWAWIFTTRDVSLLRLTASRGKKVLHSILPAYEGWVISDRYGAYRYFEDEKRQVCWSHLDRDFQRFAHSRHPLLAYQGGILIRISQEVFALDKALKALKIDNLFFYRRIRKLKKRLRYVLKRILQIPDVPHAHRVAQNLMKSFEMMWRFVDNREIEPTNNLAERQIRKYVVYRKKSLFTWSDRGNEFVERILSLFLTCRLQKQNPFLNLSKLIAAPT